MHAIARFSVESVRLSGVSATGNSFVRSVEFPVNRMVNETTERTRETNRFSSFVLKIRSFEPVRERTSQHYQEYNTAAETQQFPQNAMQCKVGFISNIIL